MTLPPTLTQSSNDPNMHFSNVVEKNVVKQRMRRMVRRRPVRVKQSFFGDIGDTFSRIGRVLTFPFRMLEGLQKFMESLMDNMIYIVIFFVVLIGGFLAYKFFKNRQAEGGEGDYGGDDFGGGEY